MAANARAPASELAHKVTGHRRRTQRNFVPLGAAFPEQRAGAPLPRVAEDAERDLEGIFFYIATNDSVDSAEHVLEQLESLCLGLAEVPLRGHVPAELDRIGVITFREVHFTPYRVIYEVIGQVVFVHGVLDGRRDIQALLERRLLRPLE